MLTLNFIPRSSVSIVNFGQINISWEACEAIFNATSILQLQPDLGYVRRICDNNSYRSKPFKFYSSTTNLDFKRPFSSHSLDLSDSSLVNTTLDKCLFFKGHVSVFICQIETNWVTGSWDKFSFLNGSWHKVTTYLTLYFVAYKRFSTGWVEKHRITV